MTWRSLLHRLSAGRLVKPREVLCLPHPKNAPGDFYVLDGYCLGEQLWEYDAPEHFASTGEHCYVSRQPESQAENQKMVAAMCVCAFACIRYKGRDPTVVAALRREERSHLIDE